MSWTKLQLVEAAYGELALASYDFDLDPEELEAALRRLDTMMATWLGLGLQLGYNAASSPDGSDLDDESGLQLIAVEAVYMGLACKLAASKGKALPSSSLRSAKSAYDSLVLTVAKAQVAEQQLASGTPRGAGQKTWRGFNSPFTTQPDTRPLNVGADGGLDFNRLGS